MAQTEFLQGEIADRFLPETDVEGLRGHEVALLSSMFTTILISILVHICVSEF